MAETSRRLLILRLQVSFLIRIESAHNPSPDVISKECLDEWDEEKKAVLKGISGSITSALLLANILAPHKMTAEPVEISCNLVYLILVRRRR